MEQAAARSASKWLVLAAVGASTFMAALDGSVVNVALPVIGAKFGEPLETMQWVVTSYVLAISSLLLVWGKLADGVGYAKVLGVGFAIFAVSSMGCGMSPSLGWLITARIVQGSGAAMMMASGPALISTTFPGEERGRALGMQATATYLGLAVGPFVGGALTTALSWHWIFFVNVPIAAAGLALVAFKLPHAPPRGRVRIDYAGAVLLAAGLAALLVGMSEAYVHGGASTRVWIPLAAAPVLLGLFVWRQARAPEPLMPLSIFRSGAFSGGVAASYLQYFVVFAVMFLVPFDLEDLRHFSAERAGLLLTAQPAVMVLVTGLAGWASDRIGPRIPATAGMVVLAIGVFALSRAGAGSSTSGTVVALAIIGLGVGAFTSPNNSAILGSAPRERQGIASALLAAARNVGMVTGVAAAALLLATLRRHLSAGGAAPDAAFMGGYRRTLTLAAVIALAGAGLSVFRPTPTRESA